MTSNRMLFAMGLSLAGLLTSPVLAEEAKQLHEGPEQGVEAPISTDDTNGASVEFNAEAEMNSEPMPEANAASDSPKSIAEKEAEQLAANDEAQAEDEATSDEEEASALGSSPVAEADGIKSESVQLDELQADQVEQLQRSLKDHGYYRAEVDGKVGPATRRALSRYYRAQAKLASAGLVYPPSAEALGLSVLEIQPVSGFEEPERANLGGTQAEASDDAPSTEEVLSKPAPSTP